MSKKIKYGVQIIYNAIKFICLKIITKGRISAKVGQLISICTYFKSENKGRINLEGRNQIEQGTLIHSAGGNIELNGVYLNRNCTIVSMNSIKIGKNVTIGPNVCIFDHDHNIKLNHEKNDAFISSPIVIEENVWIGSNVTILKGITIHKNAVIAAGASVTKNVQENEIVGGVPAKLIKVRK